MTPFGGREITFLNLVITISEKIQMNKGKSKFETKATSFFFT